VTSLELTSFIRPHNGLPVEVAVPDISIETIFFHEGSWRFAPAITRLTSESDRGSILITQGQAHLPFRDLELFVPPKGFE
jgi:hypothetical protein